MNRLEIQGSGFPATNKTWRFLRDMIYNANNLTLLGGSNYILSGCVVDANDVVSAGYIVINDELLYFEGGNLAPNIIVAETVDNTTYLEDANSDGQGDSKPTYYDRVAKFGEGANATAFDDLVRIKPLDELTKSLMKLKEGVITIAEFPAGGNTYSVSGDFISLVEQTNPNDLIRRFTVGFEAIPVGYMILFHTRNNGVLITENVDRYETSLNGTDSFKLVVHTQTPGTNLVLSLQTYIVR